MGVVERVLEKVEEWKRNGGRVRYIDAVAELSNIQGLEEIFNSNDVTENKRMMPHRIFYDPGFEGDEECEVEITPFDLVVRVNGNKVAATVKVLIP
jgi:hypothetical protein